MTADVCFFSFFGPFLFGIAMMSLQGAWPKICLWVGGVYVLFLSYSFLRSFSKGLYTVGVGGARGGHSVISHIDTCTDDDDDDDMFM